jgi:beta-galactosidase
VVRLHCGSETDFIDWNSFVWSRDRAFCGGQGIRSSRPVVQASPTLYDQALYQTARSGPDLTYALPLPPGLYTVHLKFAELWLSEPGQRPMDIQINGRTVWTAWDPATAAGQTGMAIDLRALHIAPDRDGRITLRLRAVGANAAIVQGIEIE